MAFVLTPGVEGGHFKAVGVKEFAAVAVAQSLP
jgi:hypothetical protein